MFGELDSVPVRAGSSAGDALVEALERAGRLEELGYRRVWLTEHHLAPDDVASSAPLLLVGQAATRTTRIRLSAGGMMIRNHAPLVAAEQAAMLAQLYPGRVDVGPGRSGGSEPTSDLRIRCTVLDYDSFDDDVPETVHHLGALGAGDVQMFVLAAAPGTATFAAREGLRLAVAGHVAPAEMDRAVADEVMAMSDLPDAGATLRSYTRPVEISAEVAAVART